MPYRLGVHRGRPAVCSPEERGLQRYRGSKKRRRLESIVAEKGGIIERTWCLNVSGLRARWCWFHQFLSIHPLFRRAAIVLGTNVELELVHICSGFAAAPTMATDCTRYRRTKRPRFDL